ncbi:MAG TPA: hypothetical protein VM925_26160 [Labilithrix sp.]|nr:hypothetical protein [Labilithrix sp.]
MREAPEAAARVRRLPPLEMLALALLAMLPVMPYLSYGLRVGVPRFAVAGDFALLEQATRHVWKADALLGPYSRFHWHHPGPLFFYLAAPFEAMFGTASTGLFVGTCAINACAAATLVCMVRVCATRVHAIAALAVMLAWFAAFGNVAANPWNPLVIVIPLMTYLVACALAARGESRAVIPAALFGALAASTHVAAITTVLVAGAASAVGFAIRRRRDLVQRDKRRIAIGAAVVLLALTPPVVDQLTESPGNLRTLVHFFSHREAPSKSFSTALRNSVIATSWMPDRLISRTLPDEGWIAHGMRWDAMPAKVSRTARTLAFVHVLLVTLAALVAFRRDTASLAIVAFGVLGELVALFALRSIVGDDLHYLVFWTTAASSVAWIGAFSAVFRAASALKTGAKGQRLVRGSLVVCGLLAAAIATSFQGRWLARNPAMPGSYPGMPPTMSALHAGLRERLARETATPVIHLEGAYDLAQAMVLELEKDSLDVRVAETDRWNFTGVRSGAGLSRPLHVWFSQPALPLATAPCLERLVEHAGSAVYVAPAELPSCPPQP